MICVILPITGWLGDQFSSYKVTSPELRSNVEKYFIENYNLQLITKN
jgi:hypothetical protein